MEDKTLFQEETFHDEWADSIDIHSVMVDESFECATAPENRWIMTKLGDVLGLKVLDLGAGAGEASVYFAKKGAEVTATDLSGGMLRMVERVAALHGVTVTTEKCSADTLHNESGFLDGLGACDGTVKVYLCVKWDKITLKEAVSDSDVIIHCAGDPHFGNGKHYKEINVNLTKILLDTAREYKPDLKRFVFVSSLGAVDRSAFDRCLEPLTEDSSPHPTTDYGRSKLAAEKAVAKSGLPFTIIRPAMVVGEDMRMDSHFAVFARFAITGGLIGRFGWPGKFSVVHVDDLSHALVHAAVSDDTLCKTYFCAGEQVALKDYFAALAPDKHRFPVKPFSFLLLPFACFIPFSLKGMLYAALSADDSALRTTGWAPHIPAKEALMRVACRERNRIDIKVDTGGRGQTVITGAASGLGLALFKLLAPFRSNILLLDKDADKLAELKNTYANCRTVQIDLSSEDEIKKLFVRDEWREFPITELYCCAGFGARGTVQDIDIDRQCAIIKVNVLARMMLAHKAIESMRQRHFGRVLFVCSSSAFQPMPLMAVYAAANSALLSLGEAWALEVAKDGVTILTVCPGGMDTGFQNAAGVKRLKNEKLLPPEKVAMTILSSIVKQNGSKIISFRSFAMSMLARLLPRAMAVKLWAGLMGKMR